MSQAVPGPGEHLWAGLMLLFPLMGPALEEAVDRVYTRLKDDCEHSLARKAQGIEVRHGGRIRSRGSCSKARLIHGSPWQHLSLGLCFLGIYIFYI